MPNAERQPSPICEDPTHPIADEEIERMATDPDYWDLGEEAVVSPPMPRGASKSRFVLSVALPMPLYERLTRAAEARGVPRSSYARAAVEAALDREEHPLIVRLDGTSAERLTRALERLA